MYPLFLLKESFKIALENLRGLYSCIRSSIQQSNLFIFKHWKINLESYIILQTTKFFLPIWLEPIFMPLLNRALHFGTILKSSFYYTTILISLMTLIPSPILYMVYIDAQIYDTWTLIHRHFLFLYRIFQFLILIINFQFLISIS